MQKKMLFLPNNTIHFYIDFYNSIIKIQGKSESCQFPIVSQANFVNKLRIFINVINPCKVNSIKVTTSISVKENFPNFYCMNYVPSFELYHQNGKLKKLIDIHKPSNQPEYRIFLNNFYHVPDKYDFSYTSPQYQTFPILETIDHNIFYHFSQADKLSVDLINSIFMHVNLQLITQFSTIIMMKLVNLGFGEILYQLDSNILIKLFSYLQIPLEHFDNEKLIQLEFPFAFDQSLLNDSNLTLSIPQFDNLENDMRKCLQKIITINSDIQTAMKNYINNLLNDICVHTLRNPNLNIEYYHLKSNSFEHSFTNISNIQSMIISTPFLYQFRIIDFSLKEDSYPAVINLESNSSDVYDLRLNTFKLYNNNSDVCILKINKENNHWVFGTSFEILLLLKEYILIFKDALFIRQVLIDLILSNSPFISIFVPKLLVNFTQKYILIKSQYTKEYFDQIFNILILMNKYEPISKTFLPSFIENEKLFLFSPWLVSVAPFFPEYFCVCSENVDKDYLIKINLKSLNIPYRINPIEIFTQCSDILNNGFVFNLDLWISVSVLYKNTRNNNNNNNNSNNNNNNNNNTNDDDGIYIISRNECNFSPLVIHDSFINEIKMVDTLIHSDEISEIINEIRSIIDIKNPIFNPIIDDNLQLPSIPPRVLLLLLYIVHRINYLHKYHYHNISKALWSQVQPLIINTSNELENIAISEDNSTLFILHRFEAHRIAFEGTGKQSMSIIAQVSKEFTKNPEKFRNKDSSPWHVKFTNEGAIDAGGPSRELYTEISMSIIEPTSGLFIISPNGRNKVGSRNREVYIPFHVKPANNNLIELSASERIECYTAVGVFIGIIIRKSYFQDLPFAPLVWNAIAGDKINANDVFVIDEEFKEFIMKLYKLVQSIATANSLEMH